LSKHNPNLAKSSQIQPSPAKGNPRTRLGFPWISFAELSLFKGLRGPLARKKIFWSPLSLRSIELEGRMPPRGSSNLLRVIHPDCIIAMVSVFVNKVVQKADKLRKSEGIAPPNEPMASSVSDGLREEGPADEARHARSFTILRRSHGTGKAGGGRPTARDGDRREPSSQLALSRVMSQIRMSPVRKACGWIIYQQGEWDFRRRSAPPARGIAMTNGALRAWAIALGAIVFASLFPLYTARADTSSPSGATAAGYPAHAHVRHYTHHTRSAWRSEHHDVYVQYHPYTNSYYPYTNVYYPVYGLNPVTTVAGAVVDSIAAIGVIAAYPIVCFPNYGSCPVH
jgi:hypothetical protein